MGKRIEPRITPASVFAPMRMPAKRSYAGMRADLGIYVRSRWEANIARYLNWLQSRGEIAKWAYEADTFWFTDIKRGARSYTPDFKIWETDESEPYYWEVKGYMDQKSKTKLKRMAKRYPDVRVVLIERDAYQAVAKWSRLIPGWEDER